MNNFYLVQGVNVNCENTCLLHVEYFWFRGHLPGGHRGLAHLTAGGRFGKYSESSYSRRTGSRCASKGRKDANNCRACPEPRSRVPLCCRRISRRIEGPAAELGAMQPTPPTPPLTMKSGKPGAGRARRALSRTGKECVGRRNCMTSSLAKAESALHSSKALATVARCVAFSAALLGREN